MKRYNVWTLCLVVIGIVCSQTYTGQRVPTTRSAAAGYLRGQILNTDVSSMTADQYKAWAQNIKQALTVLPRSEQQPFIRSLRNKTDQLSFETITDLQASGFENPIDVIVSAQPASSLPSKPVTPAITVRANTYEGIINELKNRYMAEIDKLSVAQTAKDNAKATLEDIANSFLTAEPEIIIDVVNALLTKLVSDYYLIPRDQLLSRAQVYNFIASVSEALRTKRGLDASKVSIAPTINESVQISDAISDLFGQINTYLGNATWFVGYSQARDPEGIMQLNKDAVACMAEYIVPVSGTTGNCLTGIVDRIINMQNKEASSIYAKNMIKSLGELSRVPRLASYVGSFDNAIGILNNHIAIIERASSETQWWISYGNPTGYEEKNIQYMVNALNLTKSNMLDQWENMINSIKDSFSNDAQMTQMRANLGLGHTAFSGLLNTTPAEDRAFGLSSSFVNWKPGLDPIGSEISYIVNDQKRTKEYKFFALATFDYYVSHILNVLAAVNDESDLKKYLTEKLTGDIREAIKNYNQ